MHGRHNLNGNLNKLIWFRNFRRARLFYACLRMVTKFIIVFIKQIFCLNMQTNLVVIKEQDALFRAICRKIYLWGITNLNTHK